MEKLLFIAPVELDDACSGPTRKVLNQYKVLSENFDAFLLGFKGNAVVLVHNGEERLLPGIKRIPRIFRLFKIVRLLDEFKFDNIYMRYAISSPQMLHFLKKAKQAGCRIIIEFPDFPYEKKCLMNKNYAAFIIDRLYRWRLKKYVSECFACCGDKVIYGMPSTQLINGILPGNWQIKNFIPTVEDNIRIISVSAVAYTHGLDRFVAGLGEYYRNGGKRNIEFHMVGDGFAMPQIKNMVEAEHLEKHVFFYGHQPNDKLDAYYDLGDISLGTLGLHRMDIHTNSTLKTREYGLKGLPTITSVQPDIYASDFPYVMLVPEDDSPVDIGKVIEFHDCIYGKEDRVEVAKKIHDYTAKHANIYTTMQPVIDAFNRK